MDFLDFIDAVDFLPREVRQVNRGVNQRDTTVWVNSDGSVPCIINGEVSLPVLRQICIIDEGSDFKVYFHYLNEDDFYLSVSFLLSEILSLVFDFSL